MRALSVFVVVFGLCAVEASVPFPAPVRSPRVYDADLVRELDNNGLRNVFLIWSTNSSLDVISALCIRSILKLYASRVYLFSNTLNATLLQRSHWSRMHLVRYNLTDIMKDTPLEHWFPSNEPRISAGPYYFSHVTDMMRFALLLRHGGLYVDTDVLVVRPISHDTMNRLPAKLPGMASVECAVLFFEPRHLALHVTLEFIRKSYDMLHWLGAGPTPLAAGYNAFLHRMDESPHYVPFQRWYPLPYTMAQPFWEEGTLTLDNFFECEAIHLWGGVARNYFWHGRTIVSRQPRTVKLRMEQLWNACSDAQ